MISVRLAHDAEEVATVVRAACKHLYELPEYQCSYYLEVEQRLQDISADADCIYLVCDGQGVLGILALSEDADFHVGHCISVVYSFVFPQHRGKGIGKLLLQLARTTAQQAASTLAYTTRKGDFEYKLIYEVCNGKES